MIMYCVDTTTILYQPTKSIPETEMVSDFTTAQQKMSKRGFKLKLHHLDNKATSSQKTFVTKVDKKFQLTPPQIYLVDATKPVIQTQKKYFT